MIKAGGHASEPKKPSTPRRYTFCTRTEEAVKPSIVNLTEALAAFDGLRPDDQHLPQK